jgi:SAM-dependent methyltransferase
MQSPDNKKIYDELWPQWHDMKVLGPASRWLRYLISDALNRSVPRNEIRSIVDVGCGEGTTTHMLAEKFPNAKVLGVDFSVSGIDIANTYYQAPNLVFMHDDRNESLRNGSYDLVSAFEVLEHIEEWKPFLDQLCSASAKYVMLSFPTGRMRAFEIEVGHFRNYQRGEVEAYLAEKGFTPVSLYYAGFPWYSPLYRELCNISNPASSKVGQGRYGVSQKLIASVLYYLFRGFSTKRNHGDQFCGIFKRT